MNPEPPSRLLDDIKGRLFAYILLGPLLSALFAEKIDNQLVSCLVFLGFVGSAFLWFRKRLDLLEREVRQLEEELAAAADKNGTTRKTHSLACSESDE
jgi:hypothetical protein